MRAGSFFPGSHYSSLFAMAGDDCSLFYDLQNLTEKQRQDHISNQELTAMLQVGLACLGHSRDHLALYEQFLEPGWRETLARYHGFFTRMVAEVVPMEHFSFHPREEFYESVATLMDRNPELTDVANLYMSSGSNLPVHKSEELLAINRRVNSKRHFSENAPAFGIPHPDTLVVRKGDLSTPRVWDFCARHDSRLMVKIEGLAGARNVSAMDSLQGCADYVAEYDDDMVVLLQERLDLEFYTEMTVDLIVKPDEVRIANVRKILFAGGVWVGNLIGESVSLTAEHRALLLKVGDYARQQGYVTEEGSNCGVDFFIGQDGSIIVTEINARWTGGLFPAEILRQVGVAGRDAVSFFDVVPIARREEYLEFLESRLVNEFEGPYAMVPVGFGCFPAAIDDTEFFYTWQIVLGDLDVFKSSKQESLGPGVMPTADMIEL